MRLHRFYIEENLRGKKEIRISDEKLLHQLRDVFRLKAGDEVVLFDGKGVDYVCRITLISKNEGVFEKIEERKAFVPERKVTLLMSLIKKENFELAIEKATEIGVSTIVPIVTERTLLKNLNTERLNRIIIEASEQCGRGDVPSLGETIDLETALDAYKNIVAFDITGNDLPAGNIFKVLGSLHQVAQPDLKNIPNLQIFILIGPEGGWSEEELTLFKEKKVMIAKLGPTTLRAETAAIVACAKVSDL